MLCPKCNIECKYEKIIDKCNKHIDNKYISNVRMIYSCNKCKFFHLQFKKQITEINI